MRPLYCDDCQKIFTRPRAEIYDPCPHCKAPPIRFATIDARLWNVLVSLARGLADTRPSCDPYDDSEHPRPDEIVAEAVLRAQREIGRVLLEALGAPLDVKEGT
jgi:hypothetical protein